MRPIILLISAVLAGSTLFAAPLAAQVSDPDTPVSSDSVGQSLAAPAVAGALQSVAVPGSEASYAERIEAPRTLRDYWHLFIAFALAWALLFGYALTLGRRFHRLDQEVQRLSENAPDAARGLRT
ncbi:MAG TPA: CcmD family protein [Longimicrobiaceae bacterium]|nr:CcmD family protein [Longimicrobiaceae bacterium]